MANSHPVNANHKHASTLIMANNFAALPYNNIPINKPSTMPMPINQQLQQQQQYQQPQQRRIVGPGDTPVFPRKGIDANPNSNRPLHLPNQIGSGPVNINHNPMAWQQQQHQQQQQQQQQLHLSPNVSYDCDEIEKNDTGSDVSTIPWGSIRPDPNYDPAKDPTSPERIDEPFVAPLEITIKVVKGRRRKTMGGYNQDHRSYHSSSTASTTVTPPYSSAGEEDRQQQPQSKWLQSQDLTTTQTGRSSIPKLGLIPTDSNSFSGSLDQFPSQEYIEEDLLELQEMQIQGGKPLLHDESKERKGMVRREFNRRLLRFNKKKSQRNLNKKEKEIAGENSNDDDYDDDDDASGNKIIINLSVDDSANNPDLPPKSFKKSVKKNVKSLYVKPFGGRIRHRRSNSMRLIVGQENGC